MSDNSSFKCIVHRVGDLVVATRDIWQEADEDHPLRLYASKGDVLEVRSVGDRFFDMYVAHPDREKGISFGVKFSEVRKLRDDENANRRPKA